MTKPKTVPKVTEMAPPKVAEMEIPRNWTFENMDVARAFDKHVREQLPWYDLATQAIAHIVRHYLPHNGLIYDIGASTGNIGNAILQTLVDRNAKIIPIDSSAEMAEMYHGPGTLVVGDVSKMELERFDVAVCFLVLQFMTKTERQWVMDSLRERLNPGGCIIIFDKMEAGEGYLSTVMYRLTMAGKLAAGTTPMQIVNKELSLSGVQRPLSLDELPNDSECWFRFGDFQGFIVEGR